MGGQPTVDANNCEFPEPSRDRKRAHRDYLCSMHERSRCRSTDPTTHVRRVRLRFESRERTFALPLPAVTLLRRHSQLTRNWQSSWAYIVTKVRDFTNERKPMGRCR